MKKLLLILLLTTVSVSFGQLTEKLFKGTLVLTNGQTKEGFIKNQSRSEYGKAVDFKTLETDATFESFTPQTLKSFTTQSGHNYETITVKVNNNIDEVTVIAEKKLKGKASLYLFEYLSKDVFVIENKGAFFVLQDDSFNSGDLEVSKYNFRGYLNLALEGFAADLKQIDFNQKTFADLVIAYNKTKDSETTIFLYKEKPVSFFTLHAGLSKGYFTNDANKSFLFQANYRTFFPALSRSTSVNIGLNYVDYKDYKESTFLGFKLTEQLNEQIISVPFTIQQNIGTNKLRPYVFGGLSWVYVKALNSSQNENGIVLAYGGGLELDIYKGLTAKLEYRDEHKSYFYLAIGFNFMK